MKHIDPKILSLQDNRVREPTTKVRISNPMLRWSVQPTRMTVDGSFNFQDHEEYSGIASAFFDAYIDPDSQSGEEKASYTFDSSVEGWTSTETSYLDVNFTSGELELIVSDDPLEPLGVMALSDRFSVDPDTLIGLTFQMMAGDDYGENGTTFGFRWYDVSDNEISYSSQGTPLTIPTGMSDYSMSATSPASAVYARVYIQPDMYPSNSQGVSAYYVDDVIASTESSGGITFIAWDAGGSVVYKGVKTLEGVGFSAEPYNSGQVCDAQRGSVHPRTGVTIVDSGFVQFESQSNTLIPFSFDDIAVAVTNNTHYLASVNGIVLTIWVRVNGTYEPIHKQQVSSDYNVSSLSWFDAVSMDKKRDMVLFNASTYGEPMTLEVHLRTGGPTGTPEVSSDPRPIIPIDVVDNYSFIRLGWLKKIEDTYVATGVIGREGSTGAHPQTWDVALRSKDGVHWSADRYSYMGHLNMRSPLLVSSSKLYKFDGLYCYEADATFLFGDYEPNAFEIKDDLLNWNLRQKAESSSATTNVISHFRKYTDPSLATYIRPGYRLERYAGYKENDTEYLSLISTEAIDSAPETFAGEKGRRVGLASRSWVHRLLDDWASDQDWQWLSQDKLYDDCSDLSHLYSLTGLVPSVHNSGYLQFDEYNDPMIMFSSRPAPTEDFYTSAVFSMENTQTGETAPFGLGTREEGQTEGSYFNHTEFDNNTYSFTDPVAGTVSINANDEANNYTYSDFLLGTGFGVLGCGQDRYNFIAAFADVANDTLYLMQRSGNEDSNSWTILDSQSFASLSKYERYSVSLKKDGISFTYKLVHYDPGNRTVLASGTYEYTESTYLGEGNTGVISNIRIPETRSWFVEPDADYVPRSWENWQDAGDDLFKEGNTTTDRFFEFHVGDEAYLGEEKLEIVKLTESQWRGAYTYLEHAWMFEMNGDRKLELEGLRTKIANVNNRIYAHHSAVSSTALASRPHLGWLLCVIQNKGYQYSSYVRDFEHTGTHTSNDPWDERIKPETPVWVDQLSFGDPDIIVLDSNDDSVVPYDIHLNPADEMVDLYDARGIDRVSYYSLMPGFWVESAGGSTRSVKPGDRHGKNTSFKVHYDDTVNVHHFISIDDEHDKSLDWVLKDIATKAGILDFSGSHQTFDTELTGTRIESNTVIDDSTIDFDVTFKMFTSQLLTNPDMGDMTGWTHTGAGSTTISDYPTPGGDDGIALLHSSGEAVLTSDAVAVSQDMGVLDLEAWGAMLSAGGNSFTAACEVYLQWLDSGDNLIKEELCGHIHGFDVNYTTRSLAPPSSAAKARVQFRHDLGDGVTNNENPIIKHCSLSTRDGNEDASPYYDTGSSFSLSLMLERATDYNIGVKLEKSGSDYELSAYQDNGTGSSYTIDRAIVPYPYSWANEVRAVKFENHIALYLDGKWAHTFTFYSPTDNPGDKFSLLNYTSPATLRAGIVSADLSCTAVQRELWTRVDGMIMDQQMSAKQGLKRAIRDQRVVFNETSDGRLIITKYNDRPYIGEVGQTVRKDSTAPSDRVPTHVRVAGAEISEYIDHASAAEYGLLFYLARAESLDEEEAYKEAGRIVRDALSYAKVHNIRFGAYLNAMSEDRVRLRYLPYDDDAELLEEMIVDDVSIKYSVGSMMADMKLRKLYE